MYRDREAFEEHERQPNTRRFLDSQDEFVASARVEFLTPGAQKGLPATDWSGYTLLVIPH